MSSPSQASHVLIQAQSTHLSFSQLICGRLNTLHKELMLTFPRVLNQALPRIFYGLTL
jgi:hypothetical protein